jgi:hypothetical protein
MIVVGDVVQCEPRNATNPTHHFSPSADVAPVPGGIDKYVRLLIVDEYKKIAARWSRGDPKEKIPVLRCGRRTGVSGSVRNGWLRGLASDGEAILDPCLSLRRLLVTSKVCASIGWRRGSYATDCYISVIQHNRLE